jgi:hypothetical protein
MKLKLTKKLHTSSWRASARKVELFYSSVKGAPDVKALAGYILLVKTRRTAFWGL